MYPELQNSIVDLPIGRLEWSSDGSIELSISASKISYASLNRFLNEIHRDNDRKEHLLLPQLKLSQPIKGKWILVYNKNGLKFFSLSEGIILWRQNLKIKFPIIIDFALNLIRFYEGNSNDQLLYPCPLTIFFEEDINSEKWKLLAIPNLKASLDDWSSMDIRLLEWFPSDHPLDKENYTSFLLAIVLHNCFAGRIFNEILSGREIFTRWLNRRIEPCVDLLDLIFNALPKNLEGEGKVLSDCIKNCITDQKKPADFQNLGDFKEMFSSYRVATKWEYEGQYNIALQILEDAPYLNWNTQVRLYKKNGDKEKAICCALEGIENGEHDLFKEALQLLLWKIKQDDNYLGNPLTIKMSEVIGDELLKINNNIYGLQYAYIQLLYFNNVETANLFLKVEDDWYWTDVLSNILKVHDFSKQDNFSRVSKLCEQGIQLIEKHVSTLGDKEHEAILYFHLMNGIAHINAVGKLKDYYYIKGAITCITKALDSAVILDDQELIEIAFQWLSFLTTYAGYFPDGIQSIIITGIRAYLQVKKTQGVIFSESQSYVPIVPLFKEYLFFPQNEIE